MQHLVNSLYLIGTRKDSRLVIIIATAFFIFLLFAAQNGKEAFEIMSFTSLAFAKRLSLFYSTFFDIQSTFTTSALALAILGALLGGINLSLAYTYIKIRGEIVVKSGIYSGIGLVFAFFGIGCAACGAAFVSVLFGFFGLSAVLDILPYHGQEIGYIGLIVLSIATYTLAKKVNTPAVC